MADDVGAPAAQAEQRSGDAVGDAASRFGAVLRQRRVALGMLQADLALATGVGRRFIIDLEAGKPTCQLGKALVVAAALGIRVVDLIAPAADVTSDVLPGFQSHVSDLPELPEPEEETP